MNFEIIDFHTHLFTNYRENICRYKDGLDITPDIARETMKKLGVVKVCGSVIDLGIEENETEWDRVKRCNEKALWLMDYFGDFYVPGFHVHPDFIEESIEEIIFMKSKGVKLIGELVPYINGWENCASKEFSEILDVAGKNDMIVNLHSQPADEMDKMVERHKDVIFVLAHPGENEILKRHIERMKKNENCYLDLSGTGIFRCGATKHLIDCVGADRLLFGSDYPTCNAGMFVGGILFDDLLTDSEKEKIFSLNAKRLLCI